MKKAKYVKLFVAKVHTPQVEGEMDNLGCHEFLSTEQARLLYDGQKSIAVEHEGEWRYGALGIDS